MCKDLVGSIIYILLLAFILVICYGKRKFLRHYYIDRFKKLTKTIIYITVLILSFLLLTYLKLNLSLGLYEICHAIIIGLNIFLLIAIIL